MNRLHAFPVIAYLLTINSWCTPHTIGAEKALTAQSGIPDSVQNAKERIPQLLLKQVLLGGPQTERDELRKFFSRLMDSPYARQLALDFIKEDIRAVLAFEDVPGTEIHIVNGKKTFSTFGGHTHRETSPETVHLNRGYLQANKEAAPDAIAHELFGHVVEHAHAKAAGVWFASQYHRDGEINASLIGWIVSAELGGKADDSWGREYINHTDRFCKDFSIMSPFYAQILSTEEMRDPAPVYLRRIQDAEQKLAGLPKLRAMSLYWLKVIAHFTGSHHKMNPASFSDIRNRFDSKLVELRNTESDLCAVKARLKFLLGRRDKMDLTDWMNWTVQLAAADRNHYFTRTDAEVDERKRILAALYSKLKPPPKTIQGRNGQFTERQLKELWDKDTAHHSLIPWKPID